jgi:phage N-6-adenine-methyltransferase
VMNQATTQLMFSSSTDDWATPQVFFDALNVEFHFELDVCGSASNAKCSRYFTVVEDGLKQDWRGSVWMNPPYGRVIKHWVQKAYESSLEGATVVCLLPARTDTSWWHNYCVKGEIRFVRGRLKFGSAASCAPFPSAVVVFRPASVQITECP